MQKSLAIVLVCALAYQAVALPAPQPGLFSGITGTITGVFDNIGDSLSNLFGGIQNITQASRDTLVKTVTPLLNIPTAVIDMGLSALNQTTAASIAALQSFTTRAGDLLNNVKLPSLTNVIDDIRSGVNGLATQIAAPVGDAMLDIAEQINNLSTQLGSSAASEIEGIVADFNNLSNQIFSELANVANPEDLTNQFLDSFQKLNEDLAALAQKFPSAKDVINKISADSQALVDVVDDTIQKIVDAAQDASEGLAQGAQGVLEQLKNAAQNVASAFANVAQDFAGALNTVYQAKVNALTVAVNSAKNAMNAAQTAATSVSNSLTTLGLEARKLIAAIPTFVSETAAQAAKVQDQMQKIVQEAINKANAFVQDATTRAEKVFADLQAATLDALAKGYNATSECAAAAAESARVQVANIVTSATTCESSKLKLVDDALTHALTQISNILDGNAALSTKVSDCVKAVNNNQMTTTQGAACLKGVKDSITTSAVQIAFTTPFADLVKAINDAEAAATTCAQQTFGLIVDNHNATLAAFQSCINAANNL